MRIPRSCYRSLLALSCWLGVDLNQAGDLRLGTPAHAAGMFLAPSGVRPLALAGAYVAGVSDTYALSYNPAGLVAAHNAILLDVGLPVQSSAFNRFTSSDPGGSILTAGHGLSIPSPTLGAVYALAPRLGWRQPVALGIAFTADYPGMQNWPSVESDPLSPARYGATNYRGTLLGKLILGAAWSPWRQLRLGVSVQTLVGFVTAVNIVSTCDGVICTQPENPSYDAAVQIASHFATIPGFQAGLQWLPNSWLTLGLAWESGYAFRSAADLRVRLPSAPIFAHASLVPQMPLAHLALQLPWQARAGVLLHPGKRFRLEAAAVYEPWAVDKKISIDIPQATIENLVALGNYGLRSLQITRGLRNTYSLRLGSEWQLPVPSDSPQLAAQLGAMFEPSAVPIAQLTPMTFDLNTFMITAGLSARHGAWHIQAMAAHLFMAQRTVTDSQVQQINAVGSSDLTDVGNGLYRSHADMFGLGAQLDF